MSESIRSPESREVRLKQDLDRLFSPELSDVAESSEWTIFGARDITRHFFPKNMSREAVRVACEGFPVRRGYLSVAFDRYQKAFRFLGKEKVTTDTVHLYVTDYEYSGGPGSDWLYVNNVDMTKPTVDYGERLAAVVQACLECPPNE